MKDSHAVDEPVIFLFFPGRVYGSRESPGMFLIELLETYPHYLGDQEDIGDLPFMFKVLSINKALSIQVRVLARLGAVFDSNEDNLHVVLCMCVCMFV